MRKLYAISVILLSLSISACSFRPEVPPIDISMISAVLTRIKQEVGVYQSIVQADRVNQNAVIENNDRRLCGNGRVDFDITAVSATLKASINNTNGLTLGITAPLPGGAGTAGANGSLSNSTLNTQILTFNVYPNLPITSTDMTLIDRPIATTLLAFRHAMRMAANELPCFSTVHDAARDPANTLELAFEATIKEGGGIDIKLVAVDLGVSADRVVVRGNSITVSFRPYDPQTQARAGGDHNPNHEFRQQMDREFRRRMERLLSSLPR